MKKSREGNWVNNQDLSFFFSAAVFSSVCMEPRIAQQKAQESRLKPKTWRKRTFREKIALIWQSTWWNHLVAKRKLSALCPQDPKIDPSIPFYRLVIKEWSLTKAGNWNISIHSIHYCLQICKFPASYFLNPTITPHWVPPCHLWTPPAVFLAQPKNKSHKNCINPMVHESMMYPLLISHKSPNFRSFRLIKDEISSKYITTFCQSIPTKLPL